MLLKNSGMQSGFRIPDWGQWFRYVTALLDVIGALRLFVPRWTRYGALLLVCTIGLATLLSVVRLYQNRAVPLILTLLAAAPCDVHD